MAGTRAADGGTRKLKRAAVRDWVTEGGTPSRGGGKDRCARLLAKFAGRGDLSSPTIEAWPELARTRRIDGGSRSAFQRPIDERFAEADVAQLRTMLEAPKADAPVGELVEFPSWNRSMLARAIRRVSLPTWILPLARVFAWLHVEGREHVQGLEVPVIFAANHQSHMDTPVIMAALPARWRYRVAPAMAKEFFKAHFFPAEYGRLAWFTSSLNYYLASLFFNAFPLPQREAGARQTLRYIGDVIEDGYSVLIFPEGKRTDTGEIDRFRPGIGMIASRLEVPVIPVRIEGLDRVLHHTWRMATPGRVRIAFGAPLYLTGDDYESLAKQVEEAVKRL